MAGKEVEIDMQTLVQIANATYAEYFGKPNQGASEAKRRMMQYTNDHRLINVALMRSSYRNNSLISGALTLV